MILVSGERPRLVGFDVDTRIGDSSRQAGDL